MGGGLGGGGFVAIPTLPDHPPSKSRGTWPSQPTVKLRSPNRSALGRCRLLFRLPRRSGACTPDSVVPAARVVGLYRRALLRWHGRSAGTIVPQYVRQAHKDRCPEKLKRLGVAMNQFHEAHGHFPAAAITDKSGTPLLSWRVAILPQLGYQSLYDEFHLDEPWDSPHNLALAAQMPDVFRCPSLPAVGPPSPATRWWSDRSRNLDRLARCSSGLVESRFAK